MPETKDDLGLVMRATQFAAQRHKDHRRKDAKQTPYINHPIALAATLSEAGVRDVESWPRPCCTTRSRIPLPRTTTFAGNSAKPLLTSLPR